MNRNELREFIREVIMEALTKELDEMSTSAGAGAFSTPFAFSKKTLDPLEDPNKEKTTLPGQHKKDDEDEYRELHEGRSKYHHFRDKTRGTPAQKIGKAISEINRQLNELDNMISISARLKTENGMEHGGLWRRTQKHLAKMEQRLLNFAYRLRELKQ